MPALSPAHLARMHDVMAGYVERGETPGAVTLLHRHGEVHVDAIGTRTAGSAERMQRDTIFRIASMTKPIAAVAAMTLVEDCRLRLDDPVDDWLPELANRRVLRTMESELDDTVPAKRPITLRDLLTFRMGFGQTMASADAYPILAAATELSIGMGPPDPAGTPAPDEWLRRLGTLPLMHQPGESWMYNTGSDVLGVLIARASGQSFEAFLEDRLFGPLDMNDTGFSVPPDKHDRFATSYWTNPETGALELLDEPATGQWSRPPAFESGAGGLVSTVDDYLAFCQMMLNGGRYGSGRILSRPAVEVMTTPQLTPEQRAAAEPFIGASRSWGFGLAIVVERDSISSSPGRFGWDGGLGTSGHVDPREGLIGILLTQAAWTSPSGPRSYHDFWTCAYQAIND